MNEQLSNVIAEVIKASKDGVVNLALLAQQQAPDLAKEVIQWGIWINVFWAVFSPIIIFVCYKVTMLGIAIRKDNEYSEFPMFLWIVSGIVFCIFVVTFFSSMQDLIKCLVAPKLYLIDYVKDLLPKPSK